MSFHVGQKVVFLGLQKGDRDYQDIVCPDTNAIYTISACRAARNWRDESVIQLCEIKNSLPVWYRAIRFRPVIERKTDISIFKKMLTPNSCERADA